MPKYEIEKHPDYFRTEESRAWMYVLFGFIIIFIIWLLSKIK